MTLGELKARMNGVRPYILADARDTDAYDHSHIPGAIPVPADEVGRLAKDYDRNIDVITYCGGYNCPASTYAAREFIKNGFRNVWDFKGGMDEWAEAGNPMEKNT